jgi:hypothetical protein
MIAMADDEHLGGRRAGRRRPKAAVAAVAITAAANNPALINRPMPRRRAMVRGMDRRGSAPWSARWSSEPASVSLTSDMVLAVYTFAALG